MHDLLKDIENLDVTRVTTEGRYRESAQALRKRYDSREENYDENRGCRALPLRASHQFCQPLYRSKQNKLTASNLPKSDSGT